MERLLLWKHGSALRIGVGVMLLALLGALALAACSSGDEQDSVAGRGNTVQEVKDRGLLRCGVKQTQPLFGFREPDGTVAGFDVEFCKAIQAALGDGVGLELVDALRRLDPLPSCSTTARSTC